MSEAAVAETEQVLDLPLDQILDSSIPNYRQHYDGVEEMAESMKKVGVLQKPIVRPSKAKDGFELVFGYKRRAAAKLAGLQTLRCELRLLTDEEVYQARLVENLQRSNPHPMDEARCLQDMIENRGYTVERIADETGKPTRYIRERLQLCNLSLKSQRALDADSITLGVALVLARIPQAKMQEEALEQVQANDSEGCASVARALEIVRDDFMLKLVDAPFDRADANLLPKAGACIVCPKRTGNQTELFADVKSPDMCTDPACYREKGTAYLKQVVAGDEGKRKLKVLSGAAAKKTFNSYQGGLSYNSEYVDLKGEQSFYVGSHTKRAKVKTLIGDEVAVTLAQDPKTGKVYELVPKKLVEEAVAKAKKEATKEAGKKKRGAKSKGKADPKEAAKRKAAAEKAAAKDQINAALVDALVHVAELSGYASLAAAPLRILAKSQANGSGFDQMIKRRGFVKEGKPVPGWYSRQRTAVDKMIAEAGGDWLWGLITEMLAWELLELDYGPKVGNLEPLLKAYGVDRKRIESDVTKALAAAKAAAPVDLKPGKKAAKKRKAKR